MPASPHNEQTHVIGHVIGHVALRLVCTVAVVLLALATRTDAVLAQRAPAPAAAPASPSPQRPPAALTLDPEGATGLELKPLARTRSFMVAAANPHAVEAGLEMLRAGGSAVDAAIAVQLVLTLVEPQSSGIGGGAFLLHWDRRAQRLRSYDGRETAPAGISPDVFLGPDGQPRGFMDAVFSGESVGTPGVVAMLALAHARHGRLPWRRLFDPAIALADKGFQVSRRLSLLIGERGGGQFSPTARAYFFSADGRPRQPGETLRNEAYAATLRVLADAGPQAFYKGPIADAIVQAVREAPTRAGRLSAKDLADYVPKERPSLCWTYRLHRVCGMGPPSSGGLVTAMTLKLIEPFFLGRLPMSPQAIHLIAEAEKLAYADRDHWVGDPDAVKVPATLLDDAYLAHRRRLMDFDRPMAKAVHGTPTGWVLHKAGLDDTHEQAGTSHVSIVDRSGNAVAMTTSVESAFGSGLMAGGFVLNNQLTDFSFRPRDAAGMPIANAVAPGKRPRSSMAPTIVFDRSGRLVAVLGSPGGGRIPLYVVKSTVGLVDWRLDAQAIADLPNFGSRNGPLEIERDLTSPLTILKLEALGHRLRVEPMTSGIHIIVRRPDGTLEGGADPRREGAARGD